MLFKTDNLFMFVEGIQFINGEYTTTDKKEIEILNRYSDSINIVVEEVKPIIENVIDEKPSKKPKKSE